MTASAFTTSVLLLEVLRAAGFFLTNDAASKAMPGTATALVEVAEEMAGELVDRLDAGEAAA